jgi:DNA-binding LacI/PurR family transcriptional regulator
LLKEIADKAQVSTSAVSLALNGKPGVSAETRDKIIKIAREFGYTPKSIERAEEIYGGSRVIRFVACTNHGIISDEYQNQPFFTELFQHIEEQCRSLGYSILYSSIRHDTFWNDIERLEDNYTSKGIILLGTNLSATEIEAVARQNPNLVIIDTLYEHLHFNFVVMNNVMGAYQAANYLIELGHRRIGYVQSVSRMYNFNARRRGFFECLESYDIPFSSDHLITVQPTVTSAQSEFITQWSEIGEPPTALFCECDYIAISVIKSLLEMGVRVPEDVSVVGFDNIGEASIITPELTTINVAKQQIAMNAVNAIISSTENTQIEHTKVIVDTSVVERRSCLNVDFSTPTHST